MVVKNISVLGSTGSIGVRTLDVIEKNRSRFRVIGLTANKNIDLLEVQIKKFNPRLVALMDEQKADQLKKRVKGCKVYGGLEGIVKVATSEEVDLVVLAIVGGRVLIPLIEAIRCKKDIALANKETMVMAGHIIMSLSLENGCKVIPIDSEHSAIFQCLDGKDTHYVKGIILTASGGPFLDRADLEDIKPSEAILHPNWQMGKKISIDSATLMNKGLEIIEAHHLFGVPVDKIKVVIHPQSIIHSMVEFVDGTLLAQLSQPDMQIPISYALTYPERIQNTVPELNMLEIGKLSFREPDLSRFPALGLAITSAHIGGSMPVVLNATDEVAVEKFLGGEIRFQEIPILIKKVMDKHQVIENPGLSEILEIDKWARLEAEKGL
ncbi:MAG: 1-deoxy-D-xylulose-5-phosphate reductoisomerase [bacterium]|nr:1-deoxy-D-xylulose-5-phosphate reductoisomerase [bacterium]